MIAKEILDARWKAIIGAVLGALMVMAGVLGYDMMRKSISDDQLNTIGNILGSDFASRLTDYGAFIWGQAFSVSGNNGIVILIVAALIGAALMAGEVSKGTVFLLLSRPLSRDRILLTKYIVGALVLLGMTILTGIVLSVVAAIAGHPQNLGGVAVSVLLFWLGSMFVLGLSTLFSVVSSDVLRPLALTVGVVLLLSVPGLFPHGGDWVLPAYWSNLPAFLGQEFPTKALIISFVAALVPVVVAVPLFRRQAY